MQIFAERNSKEASIFYERERSLSEANTQCKQRIATKGSEDKEKLEDFANSSRISCRCVDKT